MFDPVMVQGTRRPRVPGLVGTLVLFLAISISPSTARAQSPAESDTLKVEVERLRAQLDSLMRVVRDLEARGERGSGEAAEPEADPLAALRAAAAEAAGVSPGADEGATDTASPPEFVDRGSSMQALNPEISVTGDFLMLVDGDGPRENNFIAREFEISIQSNLDPYSRAKFFIGRHLPGGDLEPFSRPDGHDHEDGEFELEEGYVQWLNLPAGFSLSVGKFRQIFGQLNRWHSHTLPGQQLPLPYQAFFGDHGLAQTGASIHWLAPGEGAGTYEFWVELTRSGNPTLFGNSTRPSALGRLNAFYELSPATYFEIGLSGLTGPSAMGRDGRSSRVYGTDFALSWSPPERAQYREAVLRGGAVWGEIDSPVAGGDPKGAFGAFVIGEYKLSQRWTLGSRYEYSQDPLDPERDAWLVAPTLTWWQSEYVRIRAEYDHLRRPDGTLRQFVIQTTVSMGPHKHDNY